MRHEIIEQLEDSPVVAAIKSNEGLARCLQSDCQVVFVLYGDLCTLPEIVQQLKAVGKTVLVHIDLIEGLEAKPISVKFLKSYTEIDGIISTKAPVVKAAKNLELIAVLRFFALDSMSIEGLKRIVSQDVMDFVEVLPGVAPKLLGRLAKTIEVPLIAGGLIEDKDDVIQVLQHGALAISTTNQKVWEM